MALLAVLYTQSPEPDDHAVLRKKLGEVAALSVALDANEASRDAAAVARDAAVAEAAAIAEEAAARAVEAAQRAAVSPPPAAAAGLRPPGPPQPAPPPDGYRGYTFWSSDFHISPIADLKDLFGPMGMHIIDESLSGHCHLKKTCSRDLKAPLPSGVAAFRTRGLRGADRGTTAGRDVDNSEGRHKRSGPRSTIERKSSKLDPRFFAGRTTAGRDVDNSEGRHKRSEPRSTIERKSSKLDPRFFAGRIAAAPRGATWIFRGSERAPVSAEFPCRDAATTEYLPRRPRGGAATRPRRRRRDETRRYAGPHEAERHYAGEMPQHVATALLRGL